MVFEIAKVTIINDVDVGSNSISTVIGETDQLEIISNCLPICNPTICMPDTGQCGPTHKP